MARWLATRVASALAALLGAVTVIFVLVHLAGDPISGLVPPGSAPEDVARARAAYGLDRPLPAQYLDFLGRAARFDFGRSWRQGRPAIDAVLDRLPATLLLVGAATAIALVAGSALGILAAARPGSPWDWIASSVSLAGQAMPAFLLGGLLMLLFAVRLRWLPASGFDGWPSLVLPAVTLAAFPLATTIRLARAAVAGELGQDYVRTARGKGLSPRRAITGHVLRNAALPVLAFTGFQAAFLVSGAAVVESVFAWPGVGQLALAAVADRDLPVIQAFAMVVAVALCLVNGTTDAVARWLDPRLREQGGAA
ncbi:MAG: ABC transporter permease [Chloroflexota bacterium]